MSRTMSKISDLFGPSLGPDNKDAPIHLPQHKFPRLSPYLQPYTEFGMFLSKGFAFGLVDFWEVDASVVQANGYCLFVDKAVDVGCDNFDNFFVGIVFGAVEDSGVEGCGAGLVWFKEGGRGRVGYREKLWRW